MTANGPQSPSVPPRGVRELATIAALRMRPLPAPSKDEISRWKKLLRRRPLPRGAGR